MQKIYGYHYIVELVDCDRKTISDTQLLEKILLSVAQKARAVVMGSYFHSLPPEGVTGVVVLAESHITIHTWPEDNYAAVDLFVCGKHTQINQAINLLVQECRARDFYIKKLPRGSSK